MFAFLAPLFASITSNAVGSFFLRLGASLLFQTAARALFGTRGAGAQEIQRQLSLPTRPSDLGAPALYLDKREVTYTGDPFDFDGTPGGGGTGGDFGGADANANPFDGHVRFWIGRGAQTAPPRQFLEDASWASGGDEDLWQATDAWEGRTVIWMRLEAGPNSSRQERWPATPPLVEVEGKWSLVWDPREPSQDPDDPSTWTWSSKGLALASAPPKSPPVPPPPGVPSKSNGSPV